MAVLSSLVLLGFRHIRHIPSLSCVLHEEDLQDHLLLHKFHLQHLDYRIPLCALIRHVPVSYAGNIQEESRNMRGFVPVRILLVSSLR